MDRCVAAPVYSDWIVPGLNDPAARRSIWPMSVIGGCSSRLDNILVRKEKLVVSVSMQKSSRSRARNGGRSRSKSGRSRSGRVRKAALDAILAAS